MAHRLENNSNSSATSGQGNVSRGRRGTAIGLLGWLSCCCRSWWNNRDNRVPVSTVDSARWCQTVSRRQPPHSFIGHRRSKSWLSAVGRSRDDSDWHIHSMTLSCQDLLQLLGLHLWRLPSTDPCTIYGGAYDLKLFQLIYSNPTSWR